MVKVKINNTEYEVRDDFTILQACEQAEKEVPRFCYHDRLSIAGNCRMCLVDVEGSPKPVASCAMPVSEGMSIHTNTPSVKKAREGVMEFLLINHPLDCPVCDQGGECDLQDQTIAYGAENSRFDENKRAVEEKQMGPLIKTYMTRCIHCTRCIRFADEVAGVSDLGAVNRGENTEITTYLEKTIDSELSANIVDLCPVGALTSKPYQFEARPWELKKTETIDVMDAVGSNIRVDTYGWKVKRVLPRLNEDINEEWISDKTRYACDGLLNQRIDVPYIKKDSKLKEVSWDEVFDNINHCLTTTSPDEIAIVVGDFVDLETSFLIKKLSDSLGIKNIECRQEGCKIPFSDRSQYIFNSKINGIDETDCILIIGSNVREEAPIINSRIRKQTLNRNISIASIGENYDMTYEHDYLGNNLNVLEELLSEKNQFSKKLINAKNPMIIIGQAVLNREDSLKVFSILEQIITKFKISNNDWNGVNILQIAASRVGALDMGLYQKAKSLSDIYEEAKNGKIKLLLSFGADEIDYANFNKCNIVYIGTHGDSGANNANIILPAAAYTEKDAIYINTEGRLQYANKANFPPNESREDWKIVNQISEVLNLGWNIISLDDVRSQICQKFPLLFEDVKSVYSQLLVNRPEEFIFKNSEISPIIKDFYINNTISRFSKTMSECSRARQELRKSVS